MSVVKLRFTYLRQCFRKCSPLCPIYGDRIQNLRMLSLFAKFFPCPGASLQIYFKKEFRNILT